MLRVMAIGLVLLALNGSAGATERDARAFIHGMLGGVQATQVECSTDVREMAQIRELGAVCARFGGTFEAFRVLWAQRLSSRSADPPHDGAAPLPAAVPQTDWERRGATFERIYAVGRTVVGVRFTVGEILIVYK